MGLSSYIVTLGSLRGINTRYRPALHALDALIRLQLTWLRGWPTFIIAARQTGADTHHAKVGNGDWLDDLPHGLQTDVGERGANLSMGQRQLVALARVLIQDPAVLVLDEATASVDPFTKARIQEGLEEVFRDRTAIIIAHRLSTVKKVDRIIVLERGQILEQGTHDTLLAQGGHYARLYNACFRHQSRAYIEQSS